MALSSVTLIKIYLKLSKEKKKILFYSVSKISSAVFKIVVRTLQALVGEDLGQVQENLNFSMNFPMTSCVALSQTSSFYLIDNFQGVWPAQTSIKASVNSITAL